MKTLAWYFMKITAISLQSLRINGNFLTFILLFRYCVQIENPIADLKIKRNYILMILNSVLRFF